MLEFVDALYFTLFFIVILLLYFYFDKHKETKSIQDASEVLLDMYLAFLRNEIGILNKRKVVVFTSNNEHILRVFLNQLYLNALCSGLEMEKNFAKAHDFFTKSHVFFDEKSRLINVLLVRSGILCFIAMGARMFIFSNGHEFIKMRFNGVLDHVACLIALFVLIAFHLSVFLKYPGAWFWSKNGLSEKAKNWFLLDVFHVFPDSSTLQESWNEICDRESFMGIDLSVSKKNLVFLWEKDMEKSEKKTLQVFLDILILWEFIGLGVPSALLLLSPILVSL